MGGYRGSRLDPDCLFCFEWNHFRRTSLTHDPFQSVPRLFEAEARKVTGRGLRGLVAKNRLNHGHGLARLVKGRGGQVPDRMKPERLDPSPLAQLFHEVLPVSEGLARVPATEAPFFCDHEDMLGLLEWPTLPPPTKVVLQVAGYREPSDLHGVIRRLLGCEPDPARREVHARLSGPEQFGVWLRCGGKPDSTLAEEVIDKVEDPIALAKIERRGGPGTVFVG